MSGVIGHTMSSATLEALKGSIAKWDRIAAGTLRDRGTDNCPLCEKFHADFFTEDDCSSRDCCEGCPVFEHTHQRSCRGTPYDDYTNEGGETKVNAQRMLDFLKSLLPADAIPDEEITRP